MSETTIFFGENDLSKTVILTEKRIVNLTSNYKFIVTNKNTVTSDSNFNLFFLVMVTGQLLQCELLFISIKKVLYSAYLLASNISQPDLSTYTLSWHSWTSRQCSTIPPVFLPPRATRIVS